MRDICIECVDLGTHGTTLLFAAQTEIERGVTEIDPSMDSERTWL